MSNKVKLPEAVCNALDSLISFHNFQGYEIVGNLYSLSWSRTHDTELMLLEKYCEGDYSKIMKALVLGYEVKQCPEKVCKELYLAIDGTDYANGFRQGMKFFADAHEISYDWLV